jgi:hypothetical protein
MHESQAIGFILGCQVEECAYEGEKLACERSCC